MIMNFISKKVITLQAGVIAGLMVGSRDAQAGSDWSDIAENITTSIEALPGLISAIAYMMGLVLGVLGIMKIKDHVENPGQTQLKDGAIRMASGGALFALPIVYEAMSNTIGDTNNTVGPALLGRVEFNVQ
jgi:hypothetical protein